MNFKLIFFAKPTLIGITPILSFANQTIKSYESNVNSEWISLNAKDNVYFNDNNTYFLYQDDNLKISKNIYDYKSDIFNIYAKKPQKNYFLKIYNLEKSINNLSNNSIKIKDKNLNLISFIKNKFYADQVIKRQLFARDFFLLLDTKDNGKINEDNQSVNFKSSWGITNSSRVNNNFQFYITKKDLVNQIYLFEENQYKDLININSVQDLEMWPVNIRFLPFVKIIKTPINYGTWKDKKIKMQNVIYNVPSYYMNEKKLLLPEGHDYGQHWIWGFLDALLIGSALIGGGVLTGALRKFGINAVVSTLISGLVNGIWPSWIQTLMDDYKSISIDRYKIIETIKKIKQIIEDNSANNNVYSSFVNYSPDIYQSLNIDKEWNKTLKIDVYGQLYGEGKAATLFGTWSEMKIEQTWGVIEAHVDYNIYK